MQRVVGPLVEFLHEEAAGGIAVLVATIVALMWANGWGDGYEAFWHRELGPLDLHHWVNDGLMAVFFLVVGLEIKRESSTASCASRRAAALPAIAAVGGVVAADRCSSSLIVAGGDGRARAGRSRRRPTSRSRSGVLALLGDRVCRRHAAVPAGGRDRRRHHRHRDHRGLLRRRLCARVALAAARRAGGGDRALASARLALGAARRSRSGSPSTSPACTPRSPASSSACCCRCAMGERVEHRLHPLERVRGRAAVRARQRRGRASAAACSGDALASTLTLGDRRRPGGGQAAWA